MHLATSLIKRYWPLGARRLAIINIRPELFTDGSILCVIISALMEHMPARRRLYIWRFTAIGARIITPLGGLRHQAYSRQPINNRAKNLNSALSMSSPLRELLAAGDGMRR